MDTAAAHSRARKGSLCISDWVNLGMEVRRQGIFAQCLFAPLIQEHQRHINNIFIIWNFTVEVGIPSRELLLWAMTLSLFSSLQELHLEHQFITQTHTEVAAAAVAEILPFLRTFFWSCTYSNFYKQQSLEEYIHFSLTRKIYPSQLNDIKCITTINCALKL